MEVYMFDYNIKDQVLLLNHKTFGLENELKDLEEKIRIGQNRLHGIQRQLRRELLQGEEGFPKRISDLENSLTTAFHRISILEEILDGQFDEKELSKRMNEKVISEQYRDDIKGYLMAMVNHYNNFEYEGPTYRDETDGIDKLLSELESGLEELRNGIPLNQRFEILVKENGASFKIGKTKGDITVRMTGASFEMRTQKERGGEAESIEFFQLKDLLQAVAKIFAFEITNKTAPS